MRKNTRFRGRHYSANRGKVIYILEVHILSRVTGAMTTPQACIVGGDTIQKGAYFLD